MERRFRIIISMHMHYVKIGKMTEEEAECRTIEGMLEEMK